MRKTSWMLAAAALGLAAPLAAQSVEAGIAAWQHGDYDRAVAAWTPLAARGDADAEFNLGHAYRLGRGVTRNMATAEQYYRRAADAGHTEAQAMYGLLLFQDGRREEAIPYVRQAAEHGDARAQYVYGTALFNGDSVARDWPRAYAYMTRAAAQGLPYARTQLEAMDQNLTEADKARGRALAAEMAAPPRLASAQPSRPIPTPVPPSATPASQPPAHASTPPPAPPRAATRPAPQPQPSAPASLATTNGRWKIQLGAFSSEANARRAWSAVGRRLPGLQPIYERAGNLVRLQAGPLGSRADASRACAAAHQACFPVAP